MTACTQSLNVTIAPVATALGAAVVEPPRTDMALLQAFFAMSRVMAPPDAQAHLCELHPNILQGFAGSFSFSSPSMSETSSGAFLEKWLCGSIETRITSSWRAFAVRISELSSCWLQETRVTAHNVNANR